MKNIFVLHVLGLVLGCSVALASGTSARLKDPAEARKTYVNKCSKCHKLYNPADYSDANWEKWMGKWPEKRN